METIEKSVDVEAPISTVYNQWTQFEEFPAFMEGVESVTQLSDTRQHWVAEIGGVKREWDAEIMKQEPDQTIQWKGFGDASNMGTVAFEPIPAGTRVTVRVDWQPEGVAEKTADALGIVSSRIEGDLGRFQRFIEDRGVETGAWRGTIEGGEESTF
jgi:uncharacterized membrane protein